MLQKDGLGAIAQARSRKKKSMFRDNYVDTSHVIDLRDHRPEKIKLLDKAVSNAPKAVGIVAADHLIRKTVNDYKSGWNRLKRKF